MLEMGVQRGVTVERVPERRSIHVSGSELIWEGGMTEMTVTSAEYSSSGELRKRRDSRKMITGVRRLECVGG